MPARDDPRRPRRTGRHESAQIGMGTMVVFIAIVLVAAVAAGVLIGTSSDLEPASDGEDTETGTSGLGVESLVGRRAATDDAGLEGLEVFLVLAHGADDFDLSRLRIEVHNATASSTLHHGPVPIGERFAATAVRDADGSLRAVPPTMTGGDLVRIDIDLDAAGIGIHAGDGGHVVVLPERGEPTQVAFTTPDSYGSRLAMHLI